MKIHIEGFGIQGCLLANFLELADIDFTWHDIDAPQTAWKASTGAIYPANSTKFGDDKACYDMRAHWIQQGLVEPLECTEVCSWWFNHTSCEPHGGKFGIGAQMSNDTGALRMGASPSFHFNAQQFVRASQYRFAERRRDVRDGHADADFYVVSHGWGLRQGHVYWGWTRLVTLGHSPEFLGPNKERPAFYFRDGRFVMAYAYPKPNSPYWYAGSSILKQKTAKARSLEMPPKYEKWKANFERLSHGMVTVKGEREFIEGWRPACRDDAWVQRTGRHVEFRPCWNDGIRHFPQQLSSFGEAVGIPEFVL